MAGGYWHDPQGIDGVVSILRSMQRQIDEIRGSAGIKSAVIRSGILVIENEDGELVARIGENTTGTNPDDCGMTIGGWDETLLFAFQDADTGTSYFIVGNGASGGAWDMDDVQFRAESVTFGGSFPSAPDPFAPPVNHMQVSSDEFLIVTPELGLYELPTTSNAANMHLGTVGGLWTVARVTSSARYKTDIADATVDPADVLELSARTWIDKGDAEAAGSLVPKDSSGPRSDDSELIPYVPPRQIGFIAEEAWEKPSLQQFVGVDDDGLPNSFDYDRFASVGLHAVCKAQQERIEELERRLTALEAGR